MNGCMNQTCLIPATLHATVSPTAPHVYILTTGWINYANEQGSADQSERNYYTVVAGATNTVLVL
jgi:hypothetical protein